MTFRYVDAHVHLDAYPSLSQVLRDIARAGIVAIAMTETPSAYRRLRVGIGNNPAIRVALGMHPQKAHLFDTREQRRFMREVNSAAYVGEIGLDYTESEQHREKQRAALQVILSTAAVGRVLSLHSRRAERDVLVALRDSGAVAPILHWYSGPLGLVDEALDCGCYFSVNTAMIRTKKGAALLSRLPSDRVLTETDGPYAKHRQRPSTPVDVPAIVDSLARSWGMGAEDARRQVWDNMIGIARKATPPISA